MPLDNAGNSFSTARDIPILNGNQIRTLSDRVDSSDLNDYYKFRLQSRSSLGLTLSNSLGGNANLELLNSNGTRLNISSNNGSSSELINTTLDAGTYYIRIDYNAGSGTDYRLEINSQSTLKSDILWRNSISGQDVLWQMNGTSIASGLWLTTVADLNWKMVAAGDFNRDGQSDLVWRNHATGQNVVWLMNGTSIASGLFLTPVSDLNWQITATGDFNNDGQSDLVWRNHATGENVIWLMNGTSIATGLFITSVPDLNWQMVSSGDFNQDGQSDLVWRHAATGQNVIWLMNGTSIASGLFTNPVTDLNWKMMGSGDFDNDGQSDLVWRHATTGQNVVWFMNGTTLRAGIEIEAVRDLSWKMADITQRFEPVNTPIDLAGNTLSSSFKIGALSSDSRFTEWIGGTDSSDYYQFSVTNSSEINFTVSALNSSQNLMFDILDSAGSLVLSQQQTLTAPIKKALGTGIYYVRINANNPLTQYTLAIADSNPASITINSPNNGELLRPGGTYTITWTDNISENIAIHLFKNNAFLSTIVASIASNGSYTWTLPTDLVYGTDYSLAVSTLDARIYDFSDNYFAIKPDLKQYFFQYFFNPQNTSTTDYYLGSVIAASGKYSVTPQQSGGGYLLSDLFNATSNATEIGTDGRYLITSVVDYNDDLTYDAGRVFVTQYVDRDNGSDRFFTPIQTQSSQPSGTNYLGSELDYIDVSQLNDTRFGQDYYEADPLLPDPGNTFNTAEIKNTTIFTRNERVSATDRDDFYRFSLTQSGIFTANLTGLSGDADVRLIQDLNNNGTIDQGEILAWQWERGNGNESLRKFLNAGSYLLQVMSYNNQTANYILTTGFQAAVSDDRKFSITLNFVTGSEILSNEMRNAAREAAQFWENIIAYSSFNGLHNLKIDIGGSNQQWSNEGGILASASYRSGLVDLNGRWMPTEGIAEINNNPDAVISLTASIQYFRRVMIHEFAHILGFGTLWETQNRNLITYDTTTHATYNANTYVGLAYGELLGTFVQTRVELTSGVGEGSDYSHWKEDIFNSEMMTHEAESDGVMPLSQLTIASLRDIGWNVNYGAVELYVLPFT